MEQVVLSFNEWRQQARPWLGAGVAPSIAVPAIAASAGPPPGTLEWRNFRCPRR